MMRLLRRLISTTPANLDETVYWPTPKAMPPATPAPAPQVANLLARIDHLREAFLEEHALRRGAQQRATTAEQRLTEMVAVHAGAPLADVVERQYKTLLRYEDLLEGCRRDHGSNTKASAAPSHPGAAT